MGDLTAIANSGSDWSWRGVSLRLSETNSSGLACAGLSIAVVYLLLHTAFDALFLAVWTFPPGELPLWQKDTWWADVVNAVLIGYLPAAQAISRRGVARDLAGLRPRLRCNDAEITALSDAATGQGGPIARALSLSGLALGAWSTFVDPSMAGGAIPSSSDPWFLWSLGRNTLMVWLGVRFVVYDFNVTRIYLALGRNSVDIDLLDIRSRDRGEQSTYRSRLCASPGLIVSAIVRASPLHGDYDEEAAEDSWRRMLDFFAKHL
jgi:hypothetical protein